MYIHKYQMKGIQKKNSQDSKKKKKKAIYSPSNMVLCNILATFSGS